MSKIGKVGLTGGIGSGKSTVAKIFEGLQIPIYYADIRAALITKHNEQIIDAIKEAFGNDIFDEKGMLNKKLLAERAFKEAKQTERLNDIIHPFVLEDFKNWYDEQRAVPYILKEAAIMFESNSYKEMDKIITVYAPLELRIQRVMERDNISREAIQARIDKQMNEEEKIKRADYVIYNDGEQMLIPQVLKIHQELTEFFSKNQKLNTN